MSRPQEHFGDYQLDSAFQPIFSMGHRRIVGFEALVRGRNSDDQPVSPTALFKDAETASLELALDQSCQRVHVDNFSREADDNQWLFLNVDPGTLNNGHYRDEHLSRVMSNANLPFHRLVVEILESRAIDENVLFDAVAHYRELGALVALDDFGAGHSNFDRVWRLQPDIVKLDRSIISEATRHSTGSLRRMLPNLVSMLHDVGSLVLIEGIENADQLLVALDAEADFVQGFYLARPERDVVPADTSRAKLDQSSRQFESRENSAQNAVGQRLAAYINAIRSVRGKFVADDALEQALQPLLDMPGVLRCILLDGEGEQIEHYLSAANYITPDKRFEPLINTNGGSWARRQYFRDAINYPGTIQISRPYLSGTEGRMCEMLSIASRAEPRRVFCCKLLCDS